MEKVLGSKRWNQLYWYGHVSCKSTYSGLRFLRCQPEREIYAGHGKFKYSRYSLFNKNRTFHFSVSKSGDEVFQLIIFLLSTCVDNEIQ